MTKSKRQQKRRGKIIAMLFGVLLTMGYGANALNNNPTPSLAFMTVVRAQGPIPSVQLPSQLEDHELPQNIDSKIREALSNSPETKKIRNYLNKRGSPMASEAETFVEMAHKYSLPYNLMPAIAVIESGAGKYMYRPYNYAGMGGQGNAMVFKSYPQAIEKHAQILKYTYFDTGANTPEKMEKYYCYNCPTWGEKVTLVMRQIDQSY